jgi:hypothetical protein
MALYQTERFCKKQGNARPSLQNSVAVENLSLLLSAKNMCKVYIIYSSIFVIQF